MITKINKRLLVSLAVIMCQLSISVAQEELGNPKVYTVPAVFYPTDEVTLSLIHI